MKIDPKTLDLFESKIGSKLPEIKKSFEKGYKEFLLSELDITLAEKDEKSVILIKKEILKLNHYAY